MIYGSAQSIGESCEASTSFGPDLRKPNISRRTKWCCKQSCSSPTCLFSFSTLHSSNSFHVLCAERPKHVMSVTAKYRWWRRRERSCVGVLVLHIPVGWQKPRLSKQMAWYDHLPGSRYSTANNYGNNIEQTWVNFLNFQCVENIFMHYTHHYTVGAEVLLIGEVHKKWSPQLVESARQTKPNIPPGCKPT